MTLSKSLCTILSILLFLSCGSNTDDADPIIEEMEEVIIDEIDEDNNSNPGLVRSIDDGFKITYEYDGDMLIKAIGNDSHRNLEVGYIYNNDGTIKNKFIFDIIQHSGGGLDILYTYEYDTDGRLIEFGHNQGDVYHVSYENNQAIITAGPSFLYTLELDKMGRVVRSDSFISYKIYSYDSQGNITLAEEYDQETNELMNTYEYTYDPTENPFFGQLQSLYIANFLKTYVNNTPPFSDNIISEFSYLTNSQNLTSIRINNEQPITINYTYNSDNQFTQAEINNISDGTSKNYTFTYY